MTQHFNMFWKKKTKARFVNLLPGVEVSHPVVRSQDYPFEWFKKSAIDYKTTANNSQPDEYLFGGTSRCPGIGQLFKKGFIITAPIDFVIETKIENKKAFDWSCPIDVRQYGLPDVYVGSHSADQLSKFLPFREDTLECLVKIQTGWRISSTSDIVFLQMPVPYPDHNIFTAAHGIIDCNTQIEINVQLFWHKLNDKILIKAGTPLCQLIPINRNLDVDLIVEEANDNDKYVSTAWSYLAHKEFRRDMKSFLESTKKLLNRL